MEHPIFQKRFLSIFVPVAAGIFLFSLYLVAAAPPKNFPVGSYVSVRSGAGLLELSHELEDDGVIRSPFWFRIFSILLGGERAMRAGEYYLSERQNAFSVAKRIVGGDHDIETVKVTIPEGFTVAKIAALFDDKFFNFDRDAFSSFAQEGYLFPDTYFIPVTATASSTLRLLGDNFIRKIFDVMPHVEESGRELEEIIIMASILEGEAKSREDMQIVSGILWKRLELGMALQVDASFVYLLGKGSSELTLDDLEYESPYNTYLHPGLPPGPISNPGLNSIYAALNPTPSPYLYYLTGDDGKMYYARTHQEHVANKQKFLRR